MGGTGCIRKLSGTPIVTTCELPDDQIKTISARWPVTPIPLTWNTAFNANEVQAMVAAADTWNTFYGKTHGFNLFDTGSGQQDAVNVTNVCSSPAILSGSTFTGRVHIFKRSSWSGPGYGPQVIALTTVCHVADPNNSQFQRIFNGIMESDYVNFFISGKPLPDTQSIYLHEFGHLFGMGHSCEVGSTTQGIPDCNQLAGGNSDPYFVAVLFPTIFFDNGLQPGSLGEQRRALQPNDMGRANCIYDSQK
ncbi:MAG TPA: hypothetical protein VL588_07290 [Bdellovibrionota bacterium]|nr:hypothetical protein [Bdellovibrionota bacterium]